MQIAICERKCASCNWIGGTPEVGDFAYGQFIFAGEQGTIHAIHNSIENSNWDWVSVFAENAGNIPEIVARIADPIDGQRLRTNQVCPNCLESNWEWWDGKRICLKEIPDATFATFENLNDQRKSEAIRQIELELTTTR